MMFRNEINYKNHLIQFFHLTIEDCHRFQESGVWAQLSYGVSSWFHKAKIRHWPSHVSFWSLGSSSKITWLLTKFIFLVIGIRSIFFWAASQSCSQILKATGQSHNMAAYYFKASRRISLTRKGPITLLRNCVNSSDSPRIIPFVMNSKSSAKSLHLCYIVEPNHSMIRHCIQRSSNIQEEGW